MLLNGEKVDRAWRKSRMAARLLLRKEAGPLRPRDQSLARQLSRDPEVSNRLIQQALYYLGIGPRKHEFDQKLVAIKSRELMNSESISRRNFLTTAGAALSATALLPSATLAQSADSTPAMTPKKYPIGLELYSVRDELNRDLPNTLKQVAGMGYEVVEFYAPYFDWTVPYAKDVRTQLDGLGLKCYSTHNHIGAFKPGDGLNKAIELNQILGAKIIVMASSPAHDLESWKKVCEQLSAASDALKPHGLAAGFHNHQTEWAPLDGGARTMDVIAANTPKEFVLQLDVGTCVEAGADPVAWINANPGRIRVLHLKDWSRDGAEDRKGYHALFGEGSCPWKDIFAAAESTGGVEYYLLEQEGSRFPEFETARRCLDNYKAMRAA